MLRLMIQKKVGETWRDTDIEFTVDRMADIIWSRVHEALSLNEKPVKGIFGRVKEIKREWTMEEVQTAMSDAFAFFIKDFKLKTISLS